MIWQHDSDKDDVQGLADREKGARVWLLAPRVETYAVEVAGLALLDYVCGRTLPAAELRALYVRPTDAELNERCRV